jgi:hypothetical protein
VFKVKFREKENGKEFGRNLLRNYQFQSSGIYEHQVVEA